MSKERRTDQVNRGGWPLTVELLKANGYDPNDILAKSVDEFGYDTFSRDDLGGKLSDESGLILVHKEWHSEQFGLDVMDAIWKDEGLS